MIFSTLAPYASLFMLPTGLLSASAHPQGCMLNALVDPDGLFLAVTGSSQK